MVVIVTGGAGFIGSALVRHLIAHSHHRVVTVDALTYAANLDNLAEVAGHPRHVLERVDIRDAAALHAVFGRHDPDAVIHLAAESHVDRSIDGPAPFIETNVTGTSMLLEAARRHWAELSPGRRRAFRFVHVSTDEVFGALGAEGRFDEDSPYRPTSPYAASKASADHLARAWHATYGLPVIVTNSTNNYGPCQFPEKLIPLMILKGLAGAPMPVYGTGDNVRDWLYVDDHARALHLVLEEGAPGRTYLVGGGREMSNLDVVRAICRLLDERAPRPGGGRHDSLITFVADRPGHDRRYAVDARRIAAELGWRPRESFASGLARTVDWYLDNRAWWRRIQDGTYRGERLGLGAA